MKLYKVSNRLGDWWVTAEHPTEAEEKVVKHLDKTDYGFSKDRIVNNIKLIATKADDEKFITECFLLT
jgi:hypothetical protein